ncbi:hypothetical protein D9613_004445 [Agrocybe pediades]|uniref:Uncharacterized protein n=1 Tax=Agrocybe pediades TaxID=84607 RepID=A0A8H4QJD8_9AGAR|nr:hypothetical protein D9613_004445 [Agrocybe pediades]
MQRFSSNVVGNAANTKAEQMQDHRDSITCKKPSGWYVIVRLYNIDFRMSRRVKPLPLTPTFIFHPYTHVYSLERQFLTVPRLSSNSYSNPGSEGSSATGFLYTQNSEPQVLHLHNNIGRQRQNLQVYGYDARPSNNSLNYNFLRTATHADLMRCENEMYMELLVANHTLQVRIEELQLAQMHPKRTEGRRSLGHNLANFSKPFRICHFWCWHLRLVRSSNTPTCSKF